MTTPTLNPSNLIGPKGYTQKMLLLLKSGTPEQLREHMTLGLLGELGELADALKQHVYGKPLDPVNIVEELGDLLWYVMVCQSIKGVDLVDVDEKAWFHVTPDSSPLRPADLYASLMGRFPEILQYVYATSWVTTPPEEDRETIAHLLCDPLTPSDQSKLMEDLFQPLLNHLSACADLMGLSLAEVAEVNCAKLDTRYHKEFDLYKSEGRKGELERQEMTRALFTLGHDQDDLMVKEQA